MLHRLANPGGWGLWGWRYDLARERVDQWIEEAHEIDERIATLIVERRGLSERIRTGERSIHGGRMRLLPEREPGDTRMVALREIAFANEPAAPDTLVPIAGRALRMLLYELLVTTATSLTRDDLERLVVARGFEPPSPARQSIPNALRREIATGRVVRPARGLYRAALERDGASAGPDPTNLRSHPL